MTRTKLDSDPITHSRKLASLRNTDDSPFEADPELKNSMLYWFPVLEDLAESVPDLHIPETLFVDITRINPHEYIQEHSDEHIPDAEMESIMQCPGEWDVEQIKRAVEYIGTPVFLRTDTDSAKHDIKNGGYLNSTSPDAIDDTMTALISSAAGKGMIGQARFNCLAVRERLTLDSHFTAFDGTPIAPEVRIFAENGSVNCSHNYWPFHEDRMQSKVDGDYGVAERTAVREMTHTINAALLNTLKDVACEVSTHFDGEWSIDFALTESGDWYLIDMARGQDSWHPETCETHE